MSKCLSKRINLQVSDSKKLLKQKVMSLRVMGTAFTRHRVTDYIIVCKLNKQTKIFILQN